MRDSGRGSARIIAMTVFAVAALVAVGETRESPGASAVSVLTVPTAPQETLPQRTASQIDGPVVMHGGVKVALDSARSAYDKTSQHCSNRNVTVYMRDACRQIAYVVSRLQSLHDARLIVVSDVNARVTHDARFRVTSDTIKEGPVVWVADGSFGRDPRTAQDSTTRCGKLHFWDHSERLMYPPIRYWKIPGTDSTHFEIRGGNALWTMCQSAFPGPHPVGYLAANAGADSVEVSWTGAWVAYDSAGIQRRRFEPQPVVNWATLQWK